MQPLEVSVQRVVRSKFLLENAMSFVRSCGPCEGNGYYGILSSNTCGVCRGYGAITFEGGQEDYQDCRRCSGKGYYGVLSTDTCNLCHGVGLITLKDARVVTLTNTNPADSVWILIHPRVAAVARQRFESGQFADAVEAALKELNTVVKVMVKDFVTSELDGADLMYKAFSPKNPLVKLDDLGTTSGQNIQQGYMQLFAGAIIGIRNPKAHSNIIITRDRALHLLFLTSLLFFKLDEAK